LNQDTLDVGQKVGRRQLTILTVVVKHGITPLTLLEPLSHSFTRFMNQFGSND
jgi:hypothetical protein